MRIKPPATRTKQQPTAARRQNSKIFMDKVVDGRYEPMLFNIESARMSVAASTGPYSSTRQMRIPTGLSVTRRDIIAMDTLAKLNIAVSQHPENFSLLESNSNKPSLSNPVIMDAEDFKNTVNIEMSTKNSFPHPNDPFYQLDESIRTPRAYKNISVPDSGKIAKHPDLSFILSNIAIINQKSTYFGKSKYF